MAAMNPLTAPSRAEKPLIIYVCADTHLGDENSGENLQAFADVVNRNRPNFVLHCGDCIEAQKTQRYDGGSDREAALMQQKDFLRAWNSIDADIPHEIILGNHDVSTCHGNPSPMSEDDWIGPLGWEKRPAVGTSRAHAALTINNGDIQALAVLMCTRSSLYERDAVLKWVEDQVSGFNGDLILFADHTLEIYPDIRVLLLDMELKIPCLFLHGHYQGAPTGTRDARGLEKNGDHFPCWLQSDMSRAPIFSIFELHRGSFTGQIELGGYHRIYEGNAGDNTVSPATINYRTSV